MSEDLKKRDSKPEQKEEQVDIQRMTMPTSKEVELSFGQFTVRDLSMMDILVLLTKYADIAGLFFQLAEDNGGQLSEQQMLSILTHIPDIRSKLAFFFALCCGEEDNVGLFKKPTDDDMDILMDAIFEVVDFKRIQSNFLESRLLKRLKKNQNS